MCMDIYIYIAQIALFTTIIYHRSPRARSSGSARRNRRSPGSPTWRTSSAPRPEKRTCTYIYILWHVLTCFVIWVTYIYILYITVYYNTYRVTCSVHCWERWNRKSTQNWNLPKPLNLYRLTIWILPILMWWGCRLQNNSPISIFTDTYIIIM